MNNKQVRRRYPWHTVTLILIVAVLAGCLHGGQRDRAFTHDWADQISKESEVEARKAYIRGDGDLVLVDREGVLRTTVVTDDRGRPRVKVGKETGWSGDLDISDGGPDVKVKYKIKWGGPN